MNTCAFKSRQRALPLITMLLILYIFVNGSALGQDSAGQPEALFNEGLVHFKAADYKGAIKLWEQVAKLAPDNPVVFNNLGLAYYNLHQFSKSITAFETVLRLDPGHPNTRQDLADAYEAKKREKDARRAVWNGLLKAAVTPASQTNNADTGTGGEGRAVQGPRLGKYYVLSYGAASSPPIHLGYFQLLAGGKYQYYDTGGNLLGTGTYSFGGNTVEWTSGIFRDNGWGGEFTIEREGKTHKIRLKSNTIGTNSTDSD